MCKERRVPRNVFTDLPENTTLGWLGCACTQKLNAAKPQAGNAIILFAFDFGMKLEDDVGPGLGTTGRWRVRYGEGRFVDGVSEEVVDYSTSARGCRVIRRWERVSQLDVLLR